MLPLGDEKAERIALNELVIRQAMRAAIPLNDFGSRMAIQYAPEIAEFVDDFGFEFHLTDDHNPKVLPSAIAEMDRDDPPTSH